MPADRFEAFAEPLDRRSEEHTSELQSPCNLVCRLLLEKKNKHEFHRSLRPFLDHLRVTKLHLPLRSHDLENLVTRLVSLRISLRNVSRHPCRRSNLHYT